MKMMEDPKLLGCSSSSRSVNSELSSNSRNVIDACKSESERRKDRIRRIRTTSCTKLQDHNTSAIKSNSNNSVRPSNSIMITRTLEDSLCPTGDARRNVIRAQRKRRLLKRRLGEFMKEVVDESSGSGSGSGGQQQRVLICEDSDDSKSFSEFSSFSNLSASSTISATKFDVSFDKIAIREYRSIPGDNPSIMRGPPITIDWDHISESSYNLNLYEELRQDQRRYQSQMKMPPSVRTATLLEQGYSRREIREVTKQANIIRRQRMRTLEMMHTRKVEESFERVRRAFTKSFRSRRTKEEARFLKSYYNNDDDHHHHHVPNSTISGTRSEKNQDNHEKRDKSQSSERDDESQRKERRDMDDTKRTSNYNLEQDVTEGNSDLLEMEEFSSPLQLENQHKINDMDLSRRGKMFDLTPKGNEGTEDDYLGDSSPLQLENQHKINDMDLSRRGKIFDLTPKGNEGTEDDYLDDSYESKLSDNALSERTVSLVTDNDSDSVSVQEQKDILGMNRNESSDDSFFCLPACGVFIKIMRNFANHV